MLSLQTKPKVGGQVLLISPDLIYPNPAQPRRLFDASELESLADSIRENGVLQPLSVRRLGNGTYELIAGERRLRASRIVGLPRVPCIEIKANDSKSAVFALIENIQRKDLGFFEEAEAINKLMINYGISQDECAKKLGKAQSTLSNKLRLLKLPDDVRKSIVESGLSERHSRALLKLDNVDLQREALMTIINRQLNVADTDRLVEKILNPPKSNKLPKKIFKDIRIFINTLNHAVETMKKSGVEAKTDRIETDDFVEYTVRISKTD